MRGVGWECRICFSVIISVERRGRGNQQSSKCGQFERKYEIPVYKYKTNSSADISTCN